MLKKILASLIIAAAGVCLMVSSAGAWGIPIGNIDVAVEASNSDISRAIDFSFRPFGFAFGGGSIDGAADAAADGFIINGTIEGLVAAACGGNSQSGRTSDLGTFTENYYSGAASLGKTYTGSAIGFTETAGSNGVMSAVSSMSVTSKVTRTLQ